MKNLSVFYIGVVGLVVCGLCTDVLWPTAGRRVHFILKLKTCVFTEREI